MFVEKTINKIANTKFGIFWKTFKFANICLYVNRIIHLKKINQSLCFINQQAHNTEL